MLTYHTIFSETSVFIPILPGGGGPGAPCTLSRGGPKPPIEPFLH